jgi:hypothetical protein
MLDRPMRPTRREILASLAAASFAWRAGIGETMMIVPFQIPWDPKGLADLKRRLSATSSHFVASFRQRLGMTPGTYREAVLN